MSPLPSAGPLGIPCLAGFWSRTLARRSGAAPQKASARDWVDDNTLLAGLGLNLRETYAYLPHGASPNRSARPRVVQYLKLRPSQ
jgi:hypothetical protein